MRWRLALVGLVLALGCDDDVVRLSVDLKTDLVAGVDFIAARTEVGASSDEAVATFGTDYTDGRRIAEVGELAPGDHDVLVSLIDASGAVVASRLLRLQLSMDYVATVLVTRDCRGVTCPGAGDPSTFSTCVGGVCGDPSCSELDDSSCPAPECAADSECPALDACATPRCDRGVCVYVSGGVCGAGEYCDPELGCRAAPTIDAGVPDAGRLDAGRLDAGRLDAGRLDAGVSPGTLRAASVAAGGSHACATTVAGELLCWGESGSRQLGLPGASDLTQPARVPVPPVDQVEAYFGHTCVRRGGAVECFGRGDAFQLGVDLDPSIFTEAPQTVSLSPLVSALQPGSTTSTVLADGSAWSWGPNASAQLGLGYASSAEPPFAVAAPETVLRMSVGATHGCAVGSSGTVYCWGSGGFGQLGDGTTMDRPTPASVLIGPDASSRVALGARHTCLLRSDGLYCFGDNAVGQCGVTAPGQLSTPSPLPGLLPEEICAGETFTCARGGGSVSCFGANTYGELGRGTVSPFESTPMAVSGLTDARRIACGKHFACALRATSEIVCWGEGTSGQLGNGAIGDRSVPQLVLEPSSM